MPAGRGTSREAPRKGELEAVIPFRVPNVSCSAQPGGAPVSLSPENRSLHGHPPPLHLPASQMSLNRSRDPFSCCLSN